VTLLIELKGARVVDGRRLEGAKPVQHLHGGLVADAVRDQHQIFLPGQPERLREHGAAHHRQIALGAEAVFPVDKVALIHSHIDHRGVAEIEEGAWHLRELVGGHGLHVVGLFEAP
jgi:hypothetical protein